MKPLDPRHIECLVAATKAGTIRAAAETLGLEPSTVSRNISALEAATGMMMIERGRHGVRPTEAGLLVQGYAQQQSAAQEILQSEFDALANMKRGKVVVAIGEGFVSDLFDHALRGFATAYPDITFNVSVGSTEQVVHLVTSEQAHIGLAYNVPNDPQLRVDVSVAQPLLAVVKKGGAFDQGAPYDLATLASMPCAVPPKSFGIGTMIAASEATRGVRMRALVETGSIAALKAFVRTDMGYTILPGFVVEAEVSQGLFAAYPITAQTFSAGCASVIHKQGRRLPQAAQLFARHLKQMAAFQPN